jgi:hypothetical protein
MSHGVSVSRSVKVYLYYPVGRQETICVGAKLPDTSHWLLLNEPRRHHPGVCNSGGSRDVRRRRKSDWWSGDISAAPHYAWKPFGWRSIGCQERDGVTYCAGAIWLSALRPPLIFSCRGGRHISSADPIDILRRRPYTCSTTSSAGTGVVASSCQRTSMSHERG